MSVAEAPWLAQARANTPVNAMTTQAVLELAWAWERGQLPIAQVLVLSTGWERFVAVNHVDHETEDWRVLSRLLDELVERQTRAGFPTKHGWLTEQDLVDAQALTTRDANGNRVIQFPVGYEKTDAGLRPVYREIPDHKLAEGEDVNAAGEAG